MSASARPWAVLTTAYLGCLLGLFYPGLVDSKVPAFRDAYHFYYPQAVWLQNCAERGDYFPAWDANSGLGASCSGQASYALYYPLRLLWFVPGCSVAQRYSLFSVAHLLIAAMGAAYAAKQLALTRQAQFLAAVSYSLSCPVLFQHNNLIYLTSAAWIGFALGALIELVRSDRWWRSGVVYSLSLALMLLGGDPHAMVNALIVASGTVGVTAMRRLVSVRHSSRAMAMCARSLLARVGPWALLVGTSIPLLTAIQWVPMLRLALSSERLAPAVPLPNSSAPSAVRGTAQGTAQTESNRQLAEIIASVSSRPPQVYDFSLSPWHLTTVIWPTAGGHYLPSHSRWFVFLPAEGRMWIPSLYFGLVPCLLVIGGLRRGISPGLRWLLILALFSLLAAFGNYSPVWLVREFARAAGLTQLHDVLPPAHVGSVYWGLTQLVPGYDSFRYPAKWTVWFIAACSLAAAMRFDRAYDSKPCIGFVAKPLRTGLWGVSLSGGIIGLAIWFWSTWDPAAVNEFLGRHSDAWLGTPQLAAIGKTISVAGLLPLVVLLVLSKTSWNRPEQRLSESIESTARDATKGSAKNNALSPQAGNALGGAEASRDALQQPVFSSAKRKTPAEENQVIDHRGRFWILTVTLVEMTCAAAFTIAFVEAPSPSVLRRDLPSDSSLRVWADVSEADFPDDVEQLAIGPGPRQEAEYQDLFMLGKLSSIPGISNLAATQSISSNQLTRLRRWLARKDDMTSQQRELDQLLAQLGVTHRLVRNNQEAPEKRLVWQRVSASRPLCEFVAVVQDSDGERLSGIMDGETSSVDWEWTSSSRLVVRVKSSLSGTLLIRQFNDGGWNVSIESAGNRFTPFHLRRPTSHAEPIFLEIPVSLDTLQVVLSRKPLW